MTNHFQSLDSLLAKLKLLEKTQATNTAIQCCLDSGIILNSLSDETHKSVFPTFDPLTKDNVISFLDVLINDFKDIREGIRADVKFLIKGNEDDQTKAMILMQANVILIKAQAFITAYAREIKNQFEAMNEYEKLLKESKKVVIIINEDIKAPDLKQKLQGLWKEIWEKEVFLNTDVKDIVSEYMKADNIHFDSLYCEDCIKKFDIKETIFYTIGFSQTDKLPVEITEEAFVVQI